ncbi:DNA repair protein spr18 [Pseudozyma hubeiensis SY62]|uniref:DNA repair protein spr18 n=1 Tax=Pseudozyma hubeiensis (strain SY62) TaxID=1305764 RepID=R9P8V5_PSEHS|nr:DNA repair protein spr18 [Pseudozyma hubeiensis SY62]GAC97692.1 DNA repair protein spr18 [Pseudozyma hubeiensis SY62]
MSFIGIMPSHVHAQSSTFDTRIIYGSVYQRPAPPCPDNTPPYTPRSKSLDLLRADCATPITNRTSLDTISTLRGQRISSPVFLNRTVGVHPIPEERCRPDTAAVTRVEADHGLDGSCLTVSTESAAIIHAKARVSTMPRYISQAADLDIPLHPTTPCRRQKSDHLLKSKFSMSPVQPSKRSKSRNSELRKAVDMTVGPVPEVVVIQENTLSALGNWSHSIGIAAKKLHKSALPRKSSEESCQTTSKASNEIVKESITPQKGNGDDAFASDRRRADTSHHFSTPSRRTRKVSSTRGLTGTRRGMLTVDGVAIEHCLAPLRSAEDDAWIDADGRKSRDGLSDSEAPSQDFAAAVVCDRRLMAPVPRSRSSFRSRESQDSKSLAFPGPTRALLSPEFFEPPTKVLPPTKEIEWVDSAQPSDATHPDRPAIEFDASQVSNAVAKEQEIDAGPVTSKLKTLQLLARRPFSAFGKRIREMEKPWWPSRTSQDVVNRDLTDTGGGKIAERSQTARCSEDLLSLASPRVLDSTAMAQKSRSVELDRVQLPSTKIPIRPPGKAVFKRRPTIPDAFAKPSEQRCSKLTQSDRQPSNDAKSRISDLRHPWMKQLQLPVVARSGLGGDAGATDITTMPTWPTMGGDGLPPQRNIIAAMSLTAASVALSQAFPAASSRLSPRRPPASLLGQSLPIPPRNGRSRASTISSQSSATSSPSGKVIVSRRSYGQRLRSTSIRDETGSITSVGTSILFTDSPPNSPGLRKLMSPHPVTRTPTSKRIRSPPTTVLLPKYSPHRSARVHRLQKQPSVAFTEDSDLAEEQEWMDEGPLSSRTAHDAPVSLRPFPPQRPGFLEMSEATQTLSNLVKTFSGSSGSLSLHSSPYKKHETPEHHSNTGTPRDLYGIMEAEESDRTSPLHRLPSSTRQRLISIASMVSTEANSSFEDSEELQKLLDSIMAADLGGGSYDISGSRDMALLSPFGSPAEYRNAQHVNTSASSGGKDKESPKPTPTMPPPPKFLLNDRPISPPDSSCTSDATHSTCAPASLVHVRTCSWSSKAVAGTTSSVPDDSGYVSISGLDNVGTDSQC